jgi:hypothetical protein
MGSSNMRSFAVYTVRNGMKEGAKDYWLRIGTAFAHENGEGFNVLLNANPLDGKLVLMPPREQDEGQQEAR